MFDFGKRLCCSKHQNRSHEHNFSALTSPNEIGLLYPINYSYNYLPLDARWLKSQPISLSRLDVNCKEYKSAVVNHQAKRDNSIRLHPQATNLPIHTGLEDFRQNKYWKSNLKATKELLELFAADQRCSEVILSNGVSMSGLAKKHLDPDAVCRFTVYMFPDADETRIQLLGQSLVLIFMFDGEQKFHIGHRHRWPFTP